MMNQITNTTHLCFVYIPKYKGITDIEIVVDPHYVCHYDKQTKYLSIEKNHRIPDGFWGDGIHSVAAIVGNNGVGKSTAVEYILKAIVEGEDSRGIDGVIVYERGEELYVYSKDAIVLPSGMKIRRIDETESICCLYYSGHFIPDSAGNIRCREFAENYNISDGFLLLKDVQNYANRDYNWGGLSFFDHLLLYQTLNHIRICRFISDMDFCDLLTGYISLKYVLVNVNQSGRYAQRDYERYVANIIEQAQVIPHFRIRHKDQREQALAVFVYNNFLSILFNESHTTVDPETIRNLEEWLSFVNDTDSILEQLNTFIKTKVNNSYLSGQLSFVHNALSRLKSLASFYPGIIEGGVFYLETSSDLEKIRELADYMDKSPFLVSKIFDLAYAQDLDTDTILSSGEQGLLDLLSRLYYTIEKDCVKFCNLAAPALLILDEAEHSFHPEWQRKYLNLLFAFVKRLNEKRKIKFQILITTHSPLLLSDLPLNCVSFMEKGSDLVSRTANPDFSGTFAANVFDLYRNSFFLSDGMIGAFAKKKLECLFEHAQNGTMTLEMMNEIDWIGDKRIRYALETAVERSNHITAKDYYQRKLDELNRRNEDN